MENNAEKDPHLSESLQAERSRSEAESEDDEEERERSDDNDGTDDKEERRSAFFDRKDDEEDAKSTSLTEFLGVDKDKTVDAGGRVETETPDQEQDDTEAESQAEGLSESEAQEATLAIIDARNQELTDELDAADEDSPEELEALADAAFLESIRERLEEGNDLTEDTIEAAFNETAEDVGVEVEAEQDSDELAEAGNEDNPEENDTDAGQDESEAEAATPGNVDDDSEVDPNAPIPPPPMPPVPPFPSTPPPSPPPPGGGPGGPPPAGPNFYGSPIGPNFPAGPNAALNVANTHTETMHFIDRRRRGRDLLIGGLVGYMIGRRGGRKRTEARLMPKVEKLEKEIGTLHDVITEKEEKIRKLARAAAESRSGKLAVGTDPHELKTENSKDVPAAKKNKTDKLSYRLIESRQARAEVKQVLKRREELAKKESVKKLSKFTMPAMKVFREKRLMDGTENNPSRKRFEVMTDVELLEKVKHVKIDGMAVAEMYTKGRIDHDTLLEITKAYYREGYGDYKNILRRELRADPVEMETHRRKIERLREGREPDVSQESSGASWPDDLSNASDEEKQRYFQRFADADAQVAPIPKTENKDDKKLIKPWILVVVVLVMLAVGWLIWQGTRGKATTIDIIGCDDERQYQAIECP